LEVVEDGNVVILEFGGLQHGSMSENIERNLGEQPIARLLAEHQLKPHDLVASSSEHITHKMVSRACKGRRLTSHVQVKILTALNRATGKQFSLPDLFSY